MLYTFSNNNLPKYHEDLLIVKTNPSAPQAFSTANTAFIGTTGFDALANYEIDGLIKKVTSLKSYSKTNKFGLPMLSTIAGILPEGHPKHSQPITNIIHLEKNADLKSLHLALSSDPHIQYVSRVPVRYLLTSKKQPTTIAAVPPPANTMWNLQKIRWQDAINQGMQLAKQIRVAVLDTGVDLLHPDLPGNDIQYFYEYDEASTSSKDIVGHGTHVSGTIRAIINNNVGINGICDCKLSVYKIFSDDLVFIDQDNYFAYVVDPILYRSALAACIDNNEQVINLSIGGYGEPDEVESDLFAQLLNNGTSIVAAMGNENTSQLSYPAAISGVIAVGATKADDSRASFSNYGSHIALSAPGVAIWSTLPTFPGQTGFRATLNPSGNPTPTTPLSRETNYDAWDGTSMATPHVTAAAALVLDKHGALSPQDLKTKLMTSVDKVPGMHGRHFTRFYGAGRLNLLKI